MWNCESLPDRDLTLALLLIAAGLLCVLFAVRKIVRQR